MIFKSLLFVFSGFSVFGRRKSEDMPYRPGTAVVLLPVIGVVIGLIGYIWFRASGNFVLGKNVFAAGFVLIPLLFTGFKHIRGAASVLNALFSRPGEKIVPVSVKPAPVFVFVAALWELGLLFLFMNRTWSRRDVICCGIFFVLSRAVLALGSYLLPSLSGTVFYKANKELRTKRAASFVIFIWIGLCLCLLCSFGIWVCAAGFLGAAAAFAAIYVLIKKKLYALSYDLAGFYIVLSEMLMPLLYFAAKTIVI